MESLEHCLSSLILYNAATSFIPFGVLVLAQQELDKFTQLTNMFPPLVFQFFVMTSLIWLTAEEAAKNKAKVLSLYRQLLRSTKLLISSVLASMLFPR